MTIAIDALMGVGCTLHINHSCNRSEDCVSGQCVEGTCYNVVDNPSPGASDGGQVDSGLDGGNGFVDASVKPDATDARYDAPDSSIKPDASSSRSDVPDSSTGEASFDGADARAGDDVAFDVSSSYLAEASSSFRSFASDGSIPDSSDDGDTPTFPCGPAWAEWPMPQAQSLTGFADDPIRNLPNPQSYDLTNPDIVFDNITHLTWQRTVSTNSWTFSQAATDCSDLQLGGRTDWRLPSRIELLSIVDLTESRAGYVNTSAFGDSVTDTFWTCSSGPGNPLTVWYVDFFHGGTSLQAKSAMSRVRCVAGATDETPPSVRYTSNDVNEVYDIKTRLTWQATIAPIPATPSPNWGYFLDDCQGLGMGWRLPSMTELETLVDETQGRQAVDPTFFSNRPDGNYWTLSYEDNNPTQIWFVALGSGNTFYTVPNDASLYTRCVR